MRAALACLVVLLGIPLAARGEDFRAEQLKNLRVKSALTRKGDVVRALFTARKLAWPPSGVLIRIFKEDKALELWGRQRDGAWALVKEYAICASSGALGPKRREGDLQVPEGFYAVNHFNPTSQYHLALGVSYPNTSDRILGGQGPLGGQIYIHGNCVTIGCVPIEDEFIEEVYLAALEAHAAGQDQVPIHIFPTRLTDEGLARLSKAHPDEAELIDFWKNLKEGYDLFENGHQLPKVVVDPKGRYRFTAR
jgi:murein L,D-transpeptidase YafK